MSRSYTLQELAEFVDGKVLGDGAVEINGLNGFDLAGPGDITFLVDKKMMAKVPECRASACIVPKRFDSLGLPGIAVDRPDIAAARIHTLLLKKDYAATGIHPSAVIGSDCHMPEAISIGAHVAIGDGVQIGERVTIHPGVVIEEGVTIGNDTVIYANVTIAANCIIGDRVYLHHGAVIGSDGFGFATDAMGNHYSKPQVGNVRIDDDVQIGACSCVDCAAFGTTWIKAGVRIDNQVQVAHNVVIGENSVIVAQSGIAGSSTLGRSVVLGAKVGVSGHIHLDDGVMVAAMAGVHNSQPKGALLGGAPAFDVKKWGRATAAYSRLPEMIKEIRRLRKEVDRLTALKKEGDEI